MKRKIIPLMIITIMSMTSSVFAFSDIENHWAKDSVEKLNKTFIIKGYEDNTFRPDNYMTRAEVATILNRMNGVTKESLKYIPDITRSDWFYSEIRKAVQSGVMNGDESGAIRPNDFVTREEAITMLSRAFAIETLEESKEYKEEISDWSKEYINTFLVYNYINGYEDGLIKPKANITRAEFITIINRIFNELATAGIYTNNVSGNMFVLSNNVTLDNLVVNGNLIIPQGIKETLKTRKVLVKGNLVLRDEIDLSEITCDGKIVKLFTNDEIIENQYINDKYGIKFSTSLTAKVVEKWNTTDIDYDEKNLLIIDIEESEDYYLKSIDTIGKEEIKKVDNTYILSEKNNIKNVEYILNKKVSGKYTNKLLLIKRDNLVYKISFNRVTENNLIDNVIGTLNFYDTDYFTERKNVIYKNSKLKIKFTYRENYIGVDDSYNTNNIYSGDAPIKLFIQVNTITDIQDYSFNEVTYMLKNLARDDGILLKSEAITVYTNDALKMKIKSDDKLMYSLYVVDNNILYKFIFMSEEEIMNEIGENLFNQIVSSLQF